MDREELCFNKTTKEGDMEKNKKSKLANIGK